MSIVNLTNPNNNAKRNIFVNALNSSSVNGLANFGVDLSFPKTSIVASKTNEYIGSFIYNGSSNGYIPTAKILYFYSSGVVGSCVVNITSSNGSIVYYTGLMPSSAGASTYSIVPLNNVTALPAVQTPLIITYTTDGSFNHPNDAIVSMSIN